MTGTVTIGLERSLTLHEFVTAAESACAIDLDPSTLHAMDRAFQVAQARASEGELYGVSTGLGPMISKRVSRDEAPAMQYNLLRSHAAGMGEPLPPSVARGAALARLQSLTRNRSAVRAVLARQLAAMLNAGLAPVIPRQGGVGASGDLVQLAHAALPLIGEGECWTPRGRLASSQALSEAGIVPLKLEFRDGLALVNGTSCMVAIAAMACVGARRLLDWSLATSCVIAEISGANLQAYAAELNEAKCHAGQKAVAQKMRNHLGTPAAGRVAVPATLQAPYSVRCVPQILGPLFEALEFAGRAVENELNSASDNPVFDSFSGAALHGGNFHGESVALAMDVLKIAIVKCAILMERQLNYLLNDHINGRFTAFLNAGTPGIELGLQGVQFTATSTVAESQSIAYPASLHSIPSNKDNQDVVSMGCNAAWLTRQAVGHGFDVAAILALAVSQAAHIGDAGSLSARSKQLLSLWRDVAPPIRHDQALAGLLEKLRTALMTRDPN